MKDKEIILVTTRKEPVIKKSNHKAIENYASEMELEGDFYVSDMKDLETAKKFYQLAFDYYLIAAKYGNVDAQYALFRFYKGYGNFFTSDFEKAAFWLARSFENGNIYGTTYMAEVNKIIKEKLQEWKDSGWKWNETKDELEKFEKAKNKKLLCETLGINNIRIMLENKRSKNDTRRND